MVVSCSGSIWNSWQLQWIAGWLSTSKIKLAKLLNHRSDHFTHKFLYLIFDLRLQVYSCSWATKLYRTKLHKLALLPPNMLYTATHGHVHVHTHTHTQTHIQELLKCCVGNCVEELRSPLPTSHKEGSKKKSRATKPDKMDPLVGSIQAAFRYTNCSSISVIQHCIQFYCLFHCFIHRAVESGLKYKYYSSWDHILKVLATFYQVAAGSTLCQPFMAKVKFSTHEKHNIPVVCTDNSCVILNFFFFLLQSLPSLCDLRNVGDFPYTSELDAAFGAAVRTMGPR